MLDDEVKNVRAHEEWRAEYMLMGIKLREAVLLEDICEEVNYIADKLFDAWNMLIELKLPYCMQNQFFSDLL